MSLPRFLVHPEQLESTYAVLDGEELRHLRVRRVHVGESVVLTDGQGCERHGTVVEITRRHATVSIANEPEPPKNEPELQLTLAIAVLKGAKADLVIEKATELGVSDVIVYSSHRCVAKPSPERVTRWRRIAASAAKQSQRAHVPEIHGPISFDQMLAARGCAVRLLFWERGSSAAAWPAAVDPRRPQVLAAIGPEGGLRADEVDAAATAGFRVIRLGPRIVRAETAAIAAIVLCQQRWGDLRT